MNWLSISTYDIPVYFTLLSFVICVSKNPTVKIRHIPRLWGRFLTYTKPTLSNGFAPSFSQPMPQNVSQTYSIHAQKLLSNHELFTLQTLAGCYGYWLILPMRNPKLLKLSMQIGNSFKLSRPVFLLEIGKRDEILVINYVFSCPWCSMKRCTPASFFSTFS